MFNIGKKYVTNSQLDTCDRRKIQTSIPSPSLLRITTFSESSDHDESKDLTKDPSSSDELLDRVSKLDLGGDVREKITAIASNSTGKELDLRNVKIDPNGADVIAEGLCKNDTLQFLNLWDNSVCDDGAAAIALGLLKNSTLERLVLFHNNIGDAGAAAIAKALCSNAALQNLNLQKNNIGDDGAAAIAEGLCENSTLQILTISFNHISDVGVASIAGGLNKNTSLQSLWISGNVMTHIGILALAKVYRWTENLQRIDANLDGIHPRTVERGKRVGHGEFGSVHLAYAFGQEVVQKKSHAKSNREENYEKLILLGLPEHQNIVRVPFSEITNSLILEAHKGGSLRNCARNYGTGVPIHQFLRYSHGMCLAIEHLHKYGIVHRDIALRNYVLTEDLQSPVLIDFGLSWPIEEEKSFELRGEKMPFRQCAPEVLSTLQYSKAADIWQLGLAMWQLLHRGRQPFFQFVNGQELVQYLNKKMVEDNGWIPLSFKKNGATRILIDTVKELVVFCCPYETAERPSATEVVRKIESLRENVDVQPEEEKEVPKYKPGQNDVEAGLNAYNFTDYETLKTGGRSDYIDLKNDLAEHEYQKLDKYPDVDGEVEEDGDDLDDQ